MTILQGAVSGFVKNAKFEQNGKAILHFVEDSNNGEMMISLNGRGMQRNVKAAVIHLSSKSTIKAERKLVHFTNAQILEFSTQGIVAFEQKVKKATEAVNQLWESKAVQYALTQLEQSGEVGLIPEKEVETINPRLGYLYDADQKLYALYSEVLSVINAYAPERMEA